MIHKAVAEHSLGATLSASMDKKLKESSGLIELLPEGTARAFRLWSFRHARRIAQSAPQEAEAHIYVAALKHLILPNNKGRSIPDLDMEAKRLARASVVRACQDNGLSGTFLDRAWAIVGSNNAMESFSSTVERFRGKMRVESLKSVINSELFCNILASCESHSEAQDLVSLIEGILKQPIERRLSMWDIYSAWADGFRGWDVGPTLATELIDNVSEHRRRPHGKCRELARRFGC